MPHSPSTRSRGWRPAQHGAWFMLTLPVLVGLIERAKVEPLPLQLIPLIGCWVLGYLAFNAASGWLKSAPKRQSQYRSAVLSYGLACLVLGLITLTMAGLGILGWLVLFVPLVGLALLLVSRRAERSLSSGALTVAAASLMTLVVRFGTPAELLAAWGTPALGRAFALTAVVFGYLMGTVFYVKTMIRERGETSWLRASAVWHLLCTAAAIALADAGLLGRVWMLFFAATVARAGWLPRLGRDRPLRPMTVGLVEIGFTIAFVAATLVG